MTPLEFANKYFQLDTYLFPQEVGPVGVGREPGYVPPQGWKRLRVANYRLGASTWDRTLWQDIARRLTQPTSVRVKTIWGATEDVTLTPAQLRRHFHYPFVGKGSPEQAQIAVQLVYRFHKASTSVDQFTARNFIGLDCNGFVGNYIQKANKKSWQSIDNDKDPGPTTLIEGLINGQGRANQITDMDALAPEATYLFGFCAPDGAIYDPSKAHPTKYGHVMITEPATLKPVPEGFKIGVVEATASGKGELRYIDYTITGVTKAAHGAVFHVLRGLPTDKMDVRVARLAKT